MTEYAEFRLRIERGSRHGSYRVEASAFGASRSGTFKRPFSDTELENFVLKVGRTRRGVRRIESPEWDLAKTFGSKLFGALIQGPVAELYREAYAQARASKRGLRITLSLTDVPEVGTIPWEYLFDDPNFLSISTSTPVVRYLDLPHPRPPLAVELPIRILGVISAPSDYPALDTAAERAKLEVALKPLVDAGAVTIEWLEEANLLALHKRLQHDTFQILHYIGHGGFDDASGQGALLLEDADGRSRIVSGEQLAVILHNKDSLRLVFLNSCEGARNAVDDPFSGVATSLVERDIPAVIGMQFEITDRAAVLFASEFYAMLAEGQPVDAAITEARLAIYADHNDVEWATPVLFLRVADGRLFDVANAGTIPRADPSELVAIAVTVAPPVPKELPASEGLVTMPVPPVVTPPPAEPEPVEPEPVEPEPAAPESAEPEPAAPESAEPEPAAPEPAEPEPVEPEPVEPEPVEPELAALAPAAPAEPEPAAPARAEPAPVGPEPSAPEPVEPEPAEPEPAELGLAALAPAAPAEPEPAAPARAEPELAALAPAEPAEPEPAALAPAEPAEPEPAEPELAVLAPAEPASLAPAEPAAPEHVEPESAASARAEPEPAPPEHVEPEPALAPAAPEPAAPEPIDLVASAVPAGTEPAIRRHWRPIAVVAVAALVLLVAAVSLLPRPEPSTGRLGVTYPEPGYAHLSGYGFQPDENVTIAMDGDPVVTVTTRPDGTFDQDITIGDRQRGEFQAVSASGSTAQTAFEPPFANSSATPVASPPITPTANGCDLEEPASVAPNPESPGILVYTHFDFKPGADPKRSIYLMPGPTPGSGGGPVQLTDGTTDDTYPAWSPDHTRIVFSRGGAIYIGNFVDGRLDVPEAPLDASLDNSYFPAWSANDCIAFERRGSGIWRINPDGTGLKQVVEDPTAAAPTWSPDGLTIAYMAKPAGRDGQYDIFTVDHGGQQASVVSTPVNEMTPKWSPDGSMIAFAKGDGTDGQDIYVVEVERNRGTTQGAPEQLTDTGQDVASEGLGDGLHDSSPAWSPAGDAIVWFRGPSHPLGPTEPGGPKDPGDFRIWMMELQAPFSSKVQVSPDSLGSVHNPAWR